jgi:hypothetical protein
MGKERGKTTPEPVEGYPLVAPDPESNLEYIIQAVGIAAFLLIAFLFKLLR